MRVLADLQELSQAFGAANDLNEVLDVLLDRALSWTGASNACVILADGVGQPACIVAGRDDTGASLPLHKTERPVGADILGRVTQVKEILEVTDPQLSSGLFGQAAVKDAPLTFVPLMIGNRPAGLLVVQSSIQNEETRYFLGALALLAGDAIEHVRLSGIQRRYRSLIETIGQLGQRVSFLGELDELLAYAVESVYENFSYTRVSLYLDNRGEFVVYQVGREKSAGKASIFQIAELPDNTPVARAMKAKMPAEIADRETERDFSTAHLARDSRTELATPVKIGKKMFGVLSVESNQAHQFDAEEQFAIQLLCDLLALVVESAWLLGQSESRLSELAALINLGHAIGSVLDQRKVSQLILDGATGLTDADYAGLYLKQGDGLALTASLIRGGEESEDVTRFNEEQALAVAESCQPLLIQAPAKAGTSILSIPLRVKHRVIGVIQLIRENTDVSFDTDDERLAEALALPSSVALENARLYEETERRLAEVSTLYTLAQRMASSLDLNQMLDSLVVILRRVIDCRGCCIFLLDDRSGMLEIRAASGLKPRWQEEAKLQVGEGISGQVVQLEKPIYIPDTYKEPDFIFFDPEVRSILAVPLVTKGHVIGTLNVDDDTPNAFDEEEGLLLTIAAAQAATTIENARLYESLKERARRLKMAYDELKELNRLKSEFVQNVSHELRTPLTFIRGYVELLLDGSLGSLTSTQLEALQVVSDKTEALTRLVSDIISLQKAEMTALDLAPVSLADVIDLALRGAEIAMQEAGLSLTQKVPPDLPPVLADRSRVGQVLDNLIGNALKFTPAGGKIEIEVEDLGEFERVSVTDTGIGIPAGKQEKIFEPFYQIDGSSTRRFGGAGLGLAIVKQIVEAHGGIVGVMSEPGEGSTFYFTMPKYQPENVILSSDDLDML